MRILVIEDDRILYESLQQYLRSKNIHADCVEDERDYEIYLLSCNYDAIILDLMLKYLNGEDILKKIRAKGIDTPVLILTAKDDITDKEGCFSLGADDYLTKPFDLRELLIRLKSLSNKTHVRRVIKIGSVQIDLDAEVIYKDGIEVGLSKRAWNLLYLLVKHRGEVVSTDTIMGYVWGDKPAGDEIVRTYIKQLRRLLPDDAVSTYKGRGYKLN
ncbi:MAG: response regulator transcription factor [Nitrospirae bacterium]|nr:response regulator transcription factor [Nitrospirota bacterium]